MPAPAAGLQCVQIPVLQVGTSHVNAEVCRGRMVEGWPLPQVLCPVPVFLITPASLFFPACLTASVQALAFVRTDVSGLWHCVTLCLVPSTWSIFPTSLGGAHGGMCLCPAKACLGPSLCRSEASEMPKVAMWKPHCCVHTAHLSRSLLYALLRLSRLCFWAALCTPPSTGCHVDMAGPLIFLLPFSLVTKEGLATSSETQQTCI